MRELDTLKKAQQEGTLNPIYKIVLTKGESSYTYEGDRILPSEHDEEMYSHRAKIVLNNFDHELDDKDLKGYDAVISYGFGKEYSATAPLSVIDQQFDSDPNKLICTLDLEGMPNLMAEDEASETYMPDEDAPETVKTLVNAIVGATLAPFTHCKAFEVVWDAGYDTLADTYKPKDGFRIYGGSRLASLRRALDYTGNVPRFEDDGKVHILKPVTSGETFDYEYNLEKGHTFFSKAYRNSLVFPNRVVVKSQPDDDPQYQGEAQIDGYDSLPDTVKKTKFVRLRLESNAQGDDIAAALIAKAEMGSARGQAEIRINVGAEAFDYVKVTDQRQGDTRTGNLGYIHRRFGGDKWMMTFGFGNWLAVLRYQGILKELETYTDAGQYFSRLQVGDLYAEHILADNVDFVWIDPDNTIDLSKIGDNLDHLPNGEVYARVKTIHLSAEGGIKLDENILYQPGYNPTSKFDLGTDTLDNIPEGAVYQRVKSAALSAEGLVLLDQVTVGTYGLVKTTDISAGHIVLSSCIGDLDDIDDGSTYRKVRSTQISAGYLMLTSSTVKSGQWYNEGGVIIHADTGIHFLGTALRLYATGGQLAGYISGTTSQLLLYGVNDINVACADDIILYPVSGDIFPAYSGKYLGVSSHYWSRVYAGTYYGKSTTIQSFQKHDDVALLRGIKHKGNFLDIDTFPSELAETDEELEEARQKAIMKIERQGEKLKIAHNQIETRKKSIAIESLSEEIRQREFKDIEREEKVIKASDKEFEKTKGIMLQSIQEASTIRGVNMTNWQSLLMGSILQLADKVDGLESRLDNKDRDK